MCSSDLNGGKGMENREYEAEKARYVDTLMFRVMELESQNDILREKLNNNFIGQKEMVKPGISLVETELREKLNEANRKYRMVTEQNASLKERCQFRNVKGLRKVALIYAENGLGGIVKKIFNKN